MQIPLSCAARLIPTHVKRLKRFKIATPVILFHSTGGDNPPNAAKNFLEGLP